MKVSKTIVQALILLSIGLFSLPSCKEKRGCTDSSSSNYDPEATMYEYGSCDYNGSNIIGSYRVYESYTSQSCGSENINYNATISEGFNEGYVNITNIGNVYNSIEFQLNGGGIIAGSQTVYSSTTQSYSQLYQATGTINDDVITIDYNINDFYCGELSATVTMTKIQ